MWALIRCRAGPAPFRLRVLCVQGATPSVIPRNNASDLCRRFARSSNSRRPQAAVTESVGEPEEKASDAGKGSESTPPIASGDASGASGQGDKGPTSAPALFALPLYRKPAFPGFYQVVQVSDQEVLDFLSSLRKGGQAEYIGGFMTKDAPETATSTAGGDQESSSAGNSLGNGILSLRRNAGRVESVAELEEVGTVLQVINLTQFPNISGGHVVVMPHKRIKRTRVVSTPSPNIALAAVAVEYLDEPEIPADDDDVKALRLEMVATMKELLKASLVYKEQFEQVVRFFDIEHPLKLANLMAGMSLGKRHELQDVLAENDLVKRLQKMLEIAKKDLQFVKLQSQVKTQVEEKVSKEQRRQMLMEQMRQISKELGIEKDDKQSLIAQFREAIKDKTLPAEASKVIDAELAKLGTLEPSSSEYNVCRTYLEWLTCLPWGQFTEENTDIRKAEGILNEDHYGLEDVKERILEHMAVSFLKKSVQGKILCLVGPPGVGKTSIGKSIARALDRKFYRFSTGGMHDVAEIRGHRRTYVGAMPGKLVQCLKITQSSNPVVLIDEIDKLGRDHRGDPSSALLEVLDPEQNNTFRDHYLDVPIDLSNVLFVCTANVTDTIPGPLLDRMEVIRIAGYVFEEKVAIANQYLIPQTTEQTGIGADSLDLKEEALNKLISDYAREAGVRQLRKLIEKVSRKVALGLVRSSEKTEEGPIAVNVGNLSKYVGQPLHFSDRLFASGTPPGVVMGLAWTSMGGATLYVEARGRVPSKFVTTGSQEIEGQSSGNAADNDDTSSWKGLNGSLKVTGQLGNVMSESSQISLTYSRIFVRELDPTNSFLDEAHIHLHVPEGATPKDGPSAGVTMASALVSLALNQPIRQDLAMTGELTLTGKVLRVGGIKEKVIAARRESVTTLLLPRSNEADYSELQEYLRAGLTAHFVDHYDDIYKLAFEEAHVPPSPRPSRGQPVITVNTPVPEPSILVVDQAASEEGVDSTSDLPGPSVPSPVSLPSNPASVSSNF